MKQGLCIILVATLLCVCIAGCSAPGQGESITSSGQESPSGLASQGEFSSPSSALAESSSQESPSTPTSSTTVSQQEEEWVSPTGMHVYTSKALYDYYEANPELKEYYYTYMVPLGPMLGNSWKGASDFPTYTFVLNLFIHMPQEERNKYCHEYDLYDNDTQVSALEQEIVEETAQKYFGIDGKLLRNTKYYFPAYQAYVIGWLGLGEVAVHVITDATIQENILTLSIDRIYSYYFDHGIYPKQWPNEEEFPYQLRIRLLEDGGFQYIDCTHLG